MNEIKIRLQTLPHGANLELPRYESASAAGMDLRAALTEDMALEPGRFALIPTGFAMALPVGFEAQIRPRSGLAAKSGVTVLNAPGTVDADYRGEVKICLINHGSAPFVITRGMRIAQMVIAPVTQAHWQITAELDETARGAGGFGSTGTEG